MLTASELWQAYRTVRADLMAQRIAQGHWEGRLASSALATATAIGALAVVYSSGRVPCPRGRAAGSAPAGPEMTGHSVTFLPPGESVAPLSVGEEEIHRRIWAGLQWLAQTQNSDGGWGDTDRSPSNIATTMLVRAAVHLADRLYAVPQEASSSASGAADSQKTTGGMPAHGQKPTERFAQTLARAAQYIDQQGGLQGLRRRYGKDQTFAVPILTMYALAGLVGWQEVRPLPFEWAVLPHQVLGWLRLPVVSYAIPALVAMGQARFFHLPPRNPLLRWLRTALVEKTLQVLQAKQPDSGGFLEAVPLTSFVLMALASTGRACHPVVQRGLDFLLRTFRSEGAWPIDVNLATWVSTLSVNALVGWVDRLLRLSSNRNWLADETFGTGLAELAAISREVARTCWPWLLQCQHQKIHPFTAAAPGGWGWTDQPGAVPDADDTAGALLALAAIYRLLQEELSPSQRCQLVQAAGQGLGWLVELQNRDGGWPTFCRGWGALPFDRSATDLTAHALRALDAWKTLLAQGALPQAGLPGPFPVSLRQLQRAIQRGFRYLAHCQNPDGSWTPLWFGNAYWPGEENPIYGTARVLLAYRDLGQWDDPAAQHGLQWLVAHQNPDGGWGGRPQGACQTPKDQSSLPPPTLEKKVAFFPEPGSSVLRPSQPLTIQDWQSSVEETALALEALLADPQAARVLRQVVHLEEGMGRPFPAGAKSQATVSKEERLAWAIGRGLAWLVQAVAEGRHHQPEPIGLYFARLWYYEKLYPLVFAVSTLGQALGRLVLKETLPTAERYQR